MDKSTRKSLEVYERLQNVAGAEREIKQIGNGRIEITYKQRYKEVGMTFEQRKKALKDKLIKLKKEGK